jgi:hypothetical protein
MAAGVVVANAPPAAVRPRPQKRTIFAHFGVSAIIVLPISFEMLFNVINYFFNRFKRNAFCDYRLWCSANHAFVTI